MMFTQRGAPVCTRQIVVAWVDPRHKGEDDEGEGGDRMTEEKLATRMTMERVVLSIRMPVF